VTPCLARAVPQDVLDMTVKTYNDECRSVVMRYAGEWKRVVRRLARWIDMENDYKTLDPTFMESVWWVCKQMFDKDLIYRGYKAPPPTPPPGRAQAGRRRESSARC